MDQGEQTWGEIPRVAKSQTTQLHDEDGVAVEVPLGGLKKCWGQGAKTIRMMSGMPWNFVVPTLVAHGLLFIPRL